MRWRLTIPVLLMTLLAGCSPGVAHAGAYTVFAENKRPAAPAFAGLDGFGQPEQLADLVGNVVIINLEFPGDVNAGVQRQALRAASHVFSGRDLSTLEVTERLGPVHVVTAVVQGYIISSPDQVVLHERRQAIALGLTGIPYCLVIDRRGRIAARIVGVADPARLRATISALVQET